jgi:hypothetical protein
MQKIQKSLQLLVAVTGVVAMGATAGAQSSGLGFTPLAFDISYSSSTLQISSNNLVNAAPFGVFLGIVPNFSHAQGDDVVVTGISSSSETVDIPDFFQFGPSPANNQYVFTLTSIAETSPGVFQGAGTLVDSLDAYAFTSSTFTLAFASEYNYNVTFDTVATAVPEPSTIGLVVVGLLGALTIRRRKV